MNTSYITSATKPEQLPKLGLPEIAFIGRSNAGKSTLLNLLVGKQKIARTSREPGRTQMANFFNVDNRTTLVDLPGYGFSKTDIEVKKTWEPLIDAYLQRQQIKYLVCLLDSRREPNEEDLKLWRHLADHHPLIFVMTKIDKLNQSEKVKAERAFKNFLDINELSSQSIFQTSSLKNAGIKELKKILFGTG